MDRVLVRNSDFQRYAGHKVKVELAMPVAGRRRFKGVLLSVENSCARIRQDNGTGESEEVLLPIADMAEARLVLTDALIAEALKRSKLKRSKAGDRAAPRGQRGHSSGADRDEEVAKAQLAVRVTGTDNQGE
jgi:ribosome maturation factor RimP